MASMKTAIDMWMSAASQAGNKDLIRNSYSHCRAYTENTVERKVKALLFPCTRLVTGVAYG